MQIADMLKLKIFSAWQKNHRIRDLRIRPLSICLYTVYIQCV